MELLTEKQVSELIVEYENKVQTIIQKIKEELQNRKELKKKLEETKHSEALQLQVLERLDESEKMVRKQIDLVAKGEDNESLKQLELIKKYEQMLNEQKDIWNKYKEEYENITMTKKVRKAEAKLLCASIKYRLLVQKLKNTQRMVQLRGIVKKRQQQLQIIRLAELYVEYTKKQKRCQELWNQNKSLTAQVQQLRLAKDKEKSKQQKLDAELVKASALMKPQQLPQVDLSRFIIHRNKGNEKSDSMSINSYILEEEYINNNGQSSQTSKINSQQKAMEIDNQDSTTMDVDTQVDSHERELVQPNEPERLDFKGLFNKGGKTQCTPPADERNNNEMQNQMQPNSSNQSRSQVGEHNRAFDQKINSQGSNSDVGGNKNARKWVNPMQQQNEENRPMNTKNGNLEIEMQNECSTPSTSDRSVPTPVKMTKSSFLQKYPHQRVSKPETIHQQQYQQNNQSSKRSQQEFQQQNQFHQKQKRSSQEMMQQEQQPPSRPSSQEMYQQQKQQQPSRPSSQEMHHQQQQQASRHSSQEISREAFKQNPQQKAPQYNPAQEIHQQNQRQQEMHLRNEQHQQMEVQNSDQMDFSSNKPRITSNERANYNLQIMQRNQPNKQQQLQMESIPRKLAETPLTIRSDKLLPTVESTPFAVQAPLFAHSSTNVTPTFMDIEPSSIMNTTMYSVDTTLLPDNISAILGSEITEPGGSFELARRLHDSDLNSEDGEFDLEKLMGNNMFSPVQKKSSLNVQQHQAPENTTSTQPPANIPINQKNQDSSDRAFTFGGFGMKQSNTTAKRFF